MKAIAFLINRLLRLTHLSLTGVSAFKTPELQAFSRKAPSDFSQNQINSFCVFSGDGIPRLRAHLNEQSVAHRAGSDDTSTRRGSSSSASSMTVPGGTPSPHHSTDPFTPHYAAGPRAGSSTIWTPRVPSLISNITRRGPDSDDRGTTVSWNRSSRAHNPTHYYSLDDPAPPPLSSSSFSQQTPNFFNPMPENRNMPGAYHRSRVVSGTSGHDRPNGPRQRRRQRERSVSVASSSSYEQSRDSTPPAATRNSSTRASTGQVDGLVRTTAAVELESTQAGPSSDRRPGQRRLTEGLPTSPLRWVAGMVGWGGDEHREDELPNDDGGMR